MIASTMKTAMAAMVVGYALAKPTLQDHGNEGYDVLLTLDQFSKLNPGSLHGMAGKCSTKKRNRKHMFVKGNLDTIEDCLKWCVNVNVVEQCDIGACEYTENDGKPLCTAFKASTFKGNKVTSSKNHVGYKCYSLFSDGERRSARGLTNMPTRDFWPNNELIYDIVDASDPDSWESNGFSQSSAIKYIDRAIAEFHTKTNIRFVKRTTEADYVSVGYFGGSCSSSVGKVGGVQNMTLGRCQDKLGSIIHEFGHALGMHHEHTRADRNTYLTVPSGANHNYAIQNTDSRGIEYDFGSIMHYSMTEDWEDGYTLCAAEGGNCECVGEVRYGANEQFAYQQSTGSIACTNGVFSDPIYGTKKSCYCPGGDHIFSHTVVMTLTTEGTFLRYLQGNPTIGQREGLSQLDIAGLATVYPQLSVCKPWCAYFLGTPFFNACTWESCGGCNQCN